MSKCSVFVTHLLTWVLTPGQCILCRKGQRYAEPWIQLTYGGLPNDRRADLELFSSFLFFFQKERSNKTCGNDPGNFLTETNKIIWLNEEEEKEMTQGLEFCLPDLFVGSKLESPWEIKLDRVRESQICSILIKFLVCQGQGYPPQHPPPHWLRCNCICSLIWADWVKADCIGLVITTVGSWAAEGLWKQHCTDPTHSALPSSAHFRSKPHRLVIMC